MKITNGGKQILCGSTVSNNFPVLNGVQTTNYGAYVTAIVVDFKNNNALDWATYFGGSTCYNPGYESTRALAIDVDKNGDIFFTGHTNTTDFPPQPWDSAYFQTTGLNSGCTSCTNNGKVDAFMVKLSANGIFNIWSTLYGGDDDDIGYDIKFSTQVPYDWYFGGESKSSNFPFPNTLPAWSAGTGFFVHSNLQGVPHFGSYIGAGSSGVVNGIAIDQHRDVVLVGKVDSTSGFTILEPTSGNTGNATYGGGGSDAFITKLSHNATPSIIWSTYYGNTSAEEAYDVASAVVGGVAHYYVVGRIYSNIYGNGLPPLFNPNGGAYFQNIHGGGAEDAFVLDLDSAGNIPWATLYGGNGDEEGYSIALDNDRNIYIAGHTASSDLATATPAIFPNPNLTGAYVDNGLNGTGDLFVACFRHNSYEPVWGTYYGGAFAEGYAAIVGCYGNTSLYLCGGDVGSGIFPLYSGPGCLGIDSAYMDIAYNNSTSSYAKGFIAEFCLDPILIGISEHATSSIELSIFPNPSNGMVTVAGEINAQDEIVIDVFNLLGQSVHEEKQSPVQMINSQIDLSTLANGVYMVQVRTGNKSFTQKIIIQK
jgi:hypothetical protein